MSNLIGTRNDKPNRRTDLEEAIYDTYCAIRESEPAHRQYLGASDIGHACERHVFYTFYHAMRRTFPGRVLRLFGRGHREEEQIETELHRIGIPITTTTACGSQHNFTAMWGHSKVNLDGIIELDGKRFTLEMKTMNAKSFDHLEKNGVKKSKPEYYAQMAWQIYVAEQSGEKFDGALFFASCKNDDRIWIEEVAIDPNEQERLRQRAERIILGDAAAPLTCSENSGACRFCDYKPICRQEEFHLIEKNCRTCYYGKTAENGWTCTAGQPFGNVCDFWSLKREF